MHAGLERNFQLMPGAEWLELLLRHIRIATSTCGGLYLRSADGPKGTVCLVPLRIFLAAL